MTRRDDDGRSGRSTAGDPRIRVLLFLITGGLLLYATFDHGPRGERGGRILNAAIKADMASYRPESLAVTQQHEADLESTLHPSVVIASTMAIAVSDTSAPGALNCSVGYSVTNNSAVDINNLLFDVTYTSPQGTGSSVENISVPALSTQGITPIDAIRGRCDGVTGQVTIHHCSFSNGKDCTRITQVIGHGAIALLRSP